MPCYRKLDTFIYYDCPWIIGVRNSLTRAFPSSLHSPLSTEIIGTYLSRPQSSRNVSPRFHLTKFRLSARNPIHVVTTLYLNSVRGMERSSAVEFSLLAIRFRRTVLQAEFSVTARRTVTLYDPRKAHLKLLRIVSRGWRLSCLVIYGKTEQRCWCG